MRSVTVGILGLGNVGAGTVRLLHERRAAIEARLGAVIEVRRICVRDPGRRRAVDVAPELITADPRALIADPMIDVVVELIGGVEPACSYILAALRAGKHVVTANKAVLAERGAEIFAAAAAHGRAVYFEGSVAGGIPVLRSLREGLASDRIEAVAGIINGTSNFILDAMTRSGADFAEALRGAQAAGYAEADPGLDVSGGDAAHKLALLAMVAWGVRVHPSAIAVEGITGVSAQDIRAAGELGYLIKSLAIAHDSAAGPCLRVHPTLVPRGHVLAGVTGAYNAVLVESRALGRSLYYGRGAGMMPTAVAVVSDILELARDLVAGVAPPVAAAVRELPAPRTDAGPTAFELLEHENYLCVQVPNLPGVLGRVATCLGRHGVSISRMVQDRPGRGPVPMIMLTESVSERAMQAALAELASSPDLAAPATRIRVLPTSLG